MMWSCKGGKTSVLVPTNRFAAAAEGMMLACPWHCAACCCFSSTRLCLQLTLRLTACGVLPLPSTWLCLQLKQQPTGGCAAHPAGRRIAQRQVFLRTLVCNVQPGARLIWHDLGWPRAPPEPGMPEGCAAVPASSTAEVRQLCPSHASEIAQQAPAQYFCVRHAEQVSAGCSASSWRMDRGLTWPAGALIAGACCRQVLEVLSRAAAAVKVCWKRDEDDEGAPLLAPMEGAPDWAQWVHAWRTAIFPSAGGRGRGAENCESAPRCRG